MVTAKDRVVAALKGGCADRIPATVMLGPGCPKLCGLSVKDYLYDAAKHAQAHVDVYRMFSFDTLAIGGHVFKEAMSLGTSVEFLEDGTSKVVKRPLEDKKYLARLEIPDFKKNPFLSWYLEVLQRVAGAVSDAPVAGAVSGPWTLASTLRGIEQLLMDTMEDPPFVNQLLKFTNEFTKGWGMAVRDVGVGVGMGEAVASCYVISPKIYRDFVKAAHTEVLGYFKERKLNISLHICGMIDPIVQDVLDTGVRMLSIDAPTSLERVVELSKKKVVIMGNVPTGLFAEGTREEMDAAVKSCIDTAGKGGAFLLSSGCDIPANSRVENIRWFMEAGQKWGRCERVTNL